MAKSTKFTIEGLEKMGLSKNSDGTYSRKKSVVSNHLFEKIDFNLYPDGELVVKQKVNDSTDFEHKIITEWFIPYNVPSKKNSRMNFIRNGKQTSLPSKKHTEYVNATKKYYTTFGVEFRNTITKLNIKPPYRIEFEFFRSSHHSFDYCNACQTCEDMMKDQYKKREFIRKGWFKDDSVEFLIPYFKPYKYDKNNPGVKIKLLF